MVPFRTVEENLRTAMACYARVSERGETTEFPGVTATSSGVDMAVFNAALLTSPATRNGLEAALAVCSSHYRAKGIGWSFWLCDDFMDSDLRVSSRSVLHDRGLALVARPPGMYAERISEPSDRAPGLDCRPIQDVKTRLDFAHVSSVVFALPFSSAKRIYAEPALWQPPMKGWVGYVNNKAVSVVTVVFGADAIGVYSLGTLPQHQGCGYGETLLRHGLEEARRATGITRSILQTTDEGFNLYLKLGYRVVTSFSVYAKETCG